MLETMYNAAAGYARLGAFTYTDAANAFFYGIHGMFHIKGRRMNGSSTTYATTPGNLAASSAAGSLNPGVQILFYGTGEIRFTKSSGAVDYGIYIFER